MSTKYYKKAGYMKQHICECGEKFIGSATAKYCPSCKVDRINGHIKTNIQKRRQNVTM